MGVISVAGDPGFYATGLFSGYRDMLSKAEADTYFQLQGWHWQVHHQGGNRFF